MSPLGFTGSALPGNSGIGGALAWRNEPQETCARLLQTAFCVRCMECVSVRAVHPQTPQRTPISVWREALGLLYTLIESETKYWPLFLQEETFPPSGENWFYLMKSGLVTMVMVVFKVPGSGPVRWVLRKLWDFRHRISIIGCLAHLWIHFQAEISSVFFY